MTSGGEAGELRDGRDTTSEVLRGGAGFVSEDPGQPGEAGGPFQSCSTNGPEADHRSVRPGYGSAIRTGGRDQR